MGIKEIAKRKEWSLNFAGIDQKIQKRSRGMEGKSVLQVISYLLQIHT